MNIRQLEIYNGRFNYCKIVGQIKASLDSSINDCSDQRTIGLILSYISQPPVDQCDYFCQYISEACRCHTIRRGRQDCSVIKNTQWSCARTGRLEAFDQ